MTIWHLPALSFVWPGHVDPLFVFPGFSLHPGQKVGLIGPNGAGKTTLLRWLQGQLDVPSPLRSQQWMVVPQELTRLADTPLRQALMAQHALGPVYDFLCAQEAAGISEPEAYADAIATFAEADGYTLVAQLEEWVVRMGFPIDALERSAASFSGGEQRLLMLTAALGLGPDILLLDEPSNYLDEPALLRLSQALQAYRGSVVMVSHDRWLLDQVCTDIWALAQGQWRAWPGNYSVYAQAVAAEHQDRVRQKVRLEKEISHLEGVARSYEGWGNAREKGKTAAADSGFEGARAARLQKRALVARRRVEDRIERLQAAKPWIEKEYASAFAAIQVPDGTCLTVSELKLPGLAPFSFQIAWGSRWHISGSNGSGKTTLLRTLLGELPLQGEIYWGKPRKIGYLPQRLPVCRERPCDIFPQAQWEQARTLLGTFKVSGETFLRPMPQLSEGQQRKVHLVRLILASPNILILDEPTTHLDMPTLEKLTDMLSQFNGTLLLVSHDAYLAEVLATEELRLSAPDAA